MGHDSRPEPPFTSTVVAEGFDRWSPPLHKEFDANVRNDQLGQNLLKETGLVSVWETRLEPGERLPVHRHEQDYTWIALTDGHARQHSGDGASREITFVRGQTLHFRIDEGHHHLHDLKNIGDEPLSFLTVETKTS
ncbi:cupin domain-containing protein [Streptomyces sp. NPDC087300]|uniref:cupin domain-containing protein n=1 Tax=Streptomyces sp. NPDC087300 TaxID=3365780 RepID=UPI00382AF2ED